MPIHYTDSTLPPGARYQSVVFAQGDDYNEAEAVADRATGDDNDAWWPGLYRGCVEWCSAMIDHLSQWDNGDAGETYDTAPWGSDDDTYARDGYVLSWNTAYGHAGLVRVVQTD